MRDLPESNERAYEAWAEHQEQLRDEDMAFKIGDRVEVAPHYDKWMRGDRYGTITKFGMCLIEGHVLVKMDKSGNQYHFPIQDLTKINA